MLPCRSHPNDLAETRDERKLSLGNPFGHGAHDTPGPLTIERSAGGNLASFCLEVMQEPLEVSPSRGARRGAQILRFEPPNGGDRTVER
jgi:hypothetical protein